MPRKNPTFRRFEHELPFGCLVNRVKNFVGSGGVLLADQRLEPETTPRQMIA